MWGKRTRQEGGEGNDEGKGKRSIIREGGGGGNAIESLIEYDR